MTRKESGHAAKTAENRRLEDADAGGAKWRRWGPYLSERQWGTVREDYSPDGEAWDYLPHDQARSRAYRWGEDGIAGISDDQQRLCLALALWNGRDPILKERLFGLTGPEGNHGEDVKEYYYYLDATPTHSYLKMLYKYPQARVSLRRASRTRTRRRGKQRAGVRADRHRRLRREPLLRCVRRIRQGRARRHPDGGHRAQSRARTRRRCTCCRRCGSATPGRGAESAAKPIVAARSTGGGAGGRARRARDVQALLRGQAPVCCSATTRRTSSRLYGVDRRERLFQGRLQRLRRRG